MVLEIYVLSSRCTAGPPYSFASGRRGGAARRSSSERHSPRPDIGQISSYVGGGGAKKVRVLLTNANIKNASANRHNVNTASACARPSPDVQLLKVTSAVSLTRARCRNPPNDIDDEFHNNLNPRSGARGDAAARRCNRFSWRYVCARNADRPLLCQLDA
ncbi:hypothetical protein EVAR_42776_1 [Eumeta japonica]|uniref:Uncharacterized protein n=1 Tax=Eumeta variegata TaxID=151549 RepID=A0A4C1WKP6_EUMVA|nr:hypothetical protein EVAR_42776_1 [Eumeta japonica]